METAMLVTVQPATPAWRHDWLAGAMPFLAGGRSGNPECLRFGRFEVHPGARALVCDGHSVDIGSRAFDLLVRLLRSRGQIVSKAEIIAHVWPALFVEESNLRFQIAQLRKALGDDGHLIKTVPGRGYLLAGNGPEARESFGPGSRDDGLGQASHAPSQVNGGGSALATDGADKSQDGGLPQVAVIDPDAESAQKLCLLLRPLGLDARTYASAEAFLDSGRAGEAECVILDLWLPGRNGLELQAEFARTGALVPFIFVSSHADVDSAVRAMKAGASEFFTKPLRHLDLVEAVRRAVGSGASNASGGQPTS